MIYLSNCEYKASDGCDPLKTSGERQKHASRSIITHIGIICVFIYHVACFLLLSGAEWGCHFVLDKIMIMLCVVTSVFISCI